MRVRVNCQLFVWRRHAQLQVLSDHGKLAAPETLRYLARLRVALAFCNRLANALKLRQQFLLVADLFLRGHHVTASWAFPHWYLFFHFEPRVNQLTRSLRPIPPASV